MVKEKRVQTIWVNSKMSFDITFQLNQVLRPTSSVYFNVTIPNTYVLMNTFAFNFFFLLSHENFSSLQLTVGYKSLSSLPVHTWKSASCYYRQALTRSPSAPNYALVALRARAPINTEKPVLFINLVGNRMGCSRKKFLNLEGGYRFMLYGPVIKNSQFNRIDPTFI